MFALFLPAQVGGRGHHDTNEFEHWQKKMTIHPGTVLAINPMHAVFQKRNPGTEEWQGI